MRSVREALSEGAAVLLLPTVGEWRFWIGMPIVACNVNAERFRIDGAGDEGEDLEVKKHRSR